MQFNTLSLVFNILFVIAGVFYAGYHIGRNANSQQQPTQHHNSQQIEEISKIDDQKIVNLEPRHQKETAPISQDDDLPRDPQATLTEEQLTEYGLNDDDGSAILKSASAYICPKRETLTCAQDDVINPQRVHIISFHAVFGLHTNYYHWFFGRLVPFLHWLARIKSRDIILFVDKDERLLDKHIHYVLEKLVAQHTCAIPIFVGKSKPSNIDIRKTLNNHLVKTTPAIKAQLENLDVFLWPFERGVDLVMYGCGTLTRTTRSRLTFEVGEAYDFLRRSCSCCSARNESKEIITLIDRGTEDRKRSIPNIGRLTAYLQRGLGKNIHVQRVNFGKMKSLCEQWCAVHNSKVLIGQHGAGLTNAVMLRNKAGLIEIMPDATSFKSMYHCLAKLRGTHYTQIFQNGTHGLVRVDDALKAVKTMLNNAQTNKEIELAFPDFKPSKHMLSLKCPSELDSKPDSATVGQIGTTSMLVRSNECKNTYIQQLPIKSCYHGYNDTRNYARTRCSYAIVSMITQSDTEMALDLFLRTLARVEKYSFRTVIFATDRFTSSWVNRRMYSFPHLELKIKYCADLDMYLPDGSPNPRYRRKKDSKPYKFETKKRSRIMEMTSAMHFALRIGSRATLFVDINVIFLKPLPFLGPEHLGMIKHENEYRSTFLLARNIPVLVAWRRAFIDREMTNSNSLQSMTTSFSHFFFNKDPKYGYEHLDEDDIDNDMDLKLSTTRSRDQDLLWRSKQSNTKILTSVRFKERLSKNTTQTHLFQLLLKTSIGEDLCNVLKYSP